MSSWVTVFQFMVGNTRSYQNDLAVSHAREMESAAVYGIGDFFFFVLFTPLKCWENFFITGIDKNL